MDPQLRQQLRQTIHRAPFTGVDGFGDPTFGAAVAVLARVEDDRGTKYTPAEVETTSARRIVTEVALIVNDRIWLPGDSPADATLARTPKTVESVVDERGVLDHFETVV